MGSASRIRPGTRAQRDGHRLRHPGPAAAPGLRRAPAARPGRDRALLRHPRPRRIGRAGTVTAFADLGIHRLLLQVPQLAELRSFADDVLGSLSRNERERRAEYLTTLACYLRENSSPQRAARFLHVHPNTVAYRIKRI